MDRWHPLALPLAGLAAGAVWGGVVAAPPPVWGLVAAALVLAVAARYGGRLCWHAVLLLFWCLWGGILTGQRLEGAERADLRFFCDKGPVVLEGTVAGRPEPQPRGERIPIAVTAVMDGRVRTATDGTLLLTVQEGRTTHARGDVVRFRAAPRVPRKLGLPGEFDYPRFLALRGISATASLKEAGDLVLMRSAGAAPLRRLVDEQARRCRDAIRILLPDPAVGSIMAALTTGSQQEVPPNLNAAYTRAGVSHILSISGFHLGVLSFVLVQGLTRLLLRWEWLALRLLPRRAALLCSLPFIGWYLFFTGAAPATVRSAVMLLAVGLALWAEREDHLLTALLSAAFLMLLVEPALLFDVSFQLSFLALWGIIVLTPLFMAPFGQRLKGAARTVVQLLAASTAASLATAVPALLTFHQASFSGILTNLLIVPLLGYGATLLGAAAIPLLLWTPSPATPLLLAGGWLVRLSNGIVEWAAALPVIRSYDAGLMDLALVIAVLLALSAAPSRRVRIAVPVAALLLALLVHLWPDPPPDGRLRLTFLSVGQAESTLVHLPDGRTMLIDGGGYLYDTGRDFGERYLVPALHSLKVRRIDYLVLSHPHPDHMGGLPAVAEQFRVGEFWQGPWSSRAADYLRLLAALQRRNVPVRTLAAGDRPLTGGGVEVTVHSPAGEGLPLEEHEGGNEDSLVLRLAFGGFSALFTGDAGLPVERDMATRGQPPPVTLLKVGHHGSRSASGEPFLGRIHPRVAVISVGKGNRFGLPAPAVVGRLLRHGVELYRTDRDGTIRVESDGSGYRVETGVRGR